jgi:hypothetical protein
MRYLIVLAMCCLPAVVEAKIEVGDGPPGTVTAEEIWADQKAKHKKLSMAGTDLNCTMVNGSCAEFGEKASGKKVTIPYDDFLVMLSKVEHTVKLLNKALAENGVLVKLKGEHATIIKVQAEQIQACEAIVKSHERLGETQEQISQAVERKLAELTGEVTREKRLSRYKSEAFWLGVVAIGLWVMN